MPVVPAQIRKRNGKIVPFEKDKIITAVQKAFFAAMGDAHESEARRITDAVLIEIDKTVAALGADFVPGVEDVQDLVEFSIMEEGFYDVAKTYIIYRFERARVRDHEQEKVRERIEQRELLVQKADGRTELFSIEKVRKVINRAAEGIAGDIDVDALVLQLESEVYDGIASRDIAQALVLVARSFIERDPAYSTLAARLLLQTIVYRDAVRYASDASATFDEQYRSAFVANVERSVELGLLDERMLGFNLAALAGNLKLERDDLLRYLGAQTLTDRYFIRDKKGAGHHRFLETPQMLWMRVAMGLALNEDRKEERALEFYEALSSLRFVNSTPTLFFAGTPHPQLSSCYLSVVGDSLESIYKRYADNAQLSKWAGGIGDSWTRVRATGARILSSGIESNGVVTFLKIQDSSTIAINRSGRRRGATCVYLETWHLDIEDFLELRKNTGDDRRRTHDLNTANWIPDLFMKRVRDDSTWTLFSPDEVPDLHETYGSDFAKRYEEYERAADRGEIRMWKRVRARDLWKKMLTQLFETGHPWITFKDPSNIRSPQDHVGVVHSSNLCTEITLNTIPDEETAVCNLGSVNLARHIRDGALDRGLIGKTVTTAMRMLDNVVDLNFYPMKETRTSNMRHRPIGLGVMGFQDALFMQSIAFDSDACVTFADESMELVSYYAILASSQLAKERGAYQSYPGSKWDHGIFPVDTLDLLEQERGEKVLVDRTSRLDWTPVRESVRQHGMRNSNTMALAPTATIANIAGCFPTIEPIYKNIYVKSNISGTFIVVNEYLVEDLKREGLWNDEMLELIKGQEGNLTRISSIPQRIREKHKEVFAIDSQWLIRGAAHRGKWIDQSQSLNVFYAGTSGKDLSDVYFYAWKAGLKTTYYLRTLGVSSIEQSTVSLEKQLRLDQKREAAREAVAEIKETVAVVTQEKTKPLPSVIAPAPVTVPTPTSSSGSPKLCNIDDPDCEACQ